MNPHSLLSAGVALLITGWSVQAEDGFVPIFDGKTLDGWYVSPKTGHSRASNHQSGGRWVVEDGAIVGSQDIPGNGGILITEQDYGDFEIVLEMNNDFGPDSGLFLRTKAASLSRSTAAVISPSNTSATAISGSRNWKQAPKKSETSADWRSAVSPIAR